jgi:hypothetical protein
MNEKQRLLAEQIEGYALRCNVDVVSAAEKIFALEGGPEKHDACAMVAATGEVLKRQVGGEGPWERVGYAQGALAHDQKNIRSLASSEEISLSEAEDRLYERGHLLYKGRVVPGSFATPYTHPRPTAEEASRRLREAGEKWAAFSGDLAKVRALAEREGITEEEAEIRLFEKGVIR